MSQYAAPEDFNLESWLENIGLGQYNELFHEQGITPALLPSLTDEDLRAIGVGVFGHRKLLLLSIAALSQSPPAETESKPEAKSSPTLSPFSLEPALPTESGGFFPLPEPIPEHVPAALDRAGADSKPPGRWSSKRFGSQFLFVSIALHILLGIGATVFVVQTIQAKRKVTFQAGPKSPNPSTRAIEHKVSMVKKQNTMSAPAQMKRITSISASKISLPAMPAMPKMDEFTPVQMAGMGGTGVGPSFGGAGGPGGGTGGSGLTLFGFRTSDSGGIRGDFYDLKQTKDGKPSGLGEAQYPDILRNFARKNFNESELAAYFKAPTPLYAGQIFIPSIDASEGPKAFGVEKLVAPKMWAVVYRGKVVAPESGRYRFYGICDDFMVVRFKGRVVLDHGSYSLTGWTAKKTHFYDPTWPLVGARDWYNQRGHAESDDFDVIAGNSYDLEILIGEHPGGYFTAQLMIEKIGAKYETDGRNNPVLPIFKMAKTPDPEHKLLPPFASEGRVWTGSTPKKIGFGR